MNAPVMEGTFNMVRKPGVVYYTVILTSDIHTLLVIRRKSIPLKEVRVYFRNFFRDSLRVQKFQTVITSLFIGIWVSN